MVEIAIEDDGPGIPEAYRAKVFEPFVRLDEQPAGENSGTGLGLTIARDVVLVAWRRSPARAVAPRRPARRAAAAGLSRCQQRPRAGSHPGLRQPDPGPAAACGRRRVHRRPRRWSTRPACATSLHADGVPVEDAAVALAELKAAQVATWAPDDAIVLGADQLLELEGEWLEKPASLRGGAPPAARGCAAAGTGW